LSCLRWFHIDPQAKGGPPTLSNVALRCKAHNGYAAEADYGAEVVARRIAEARQSSEHEHSPRGQCRRPSCSTRWNCAADSLQGAARNPRRVAQIGLAKAITHAL
jgi:hypothetical protein